MTTMMRLMMIRNYWHNALIVFTVEIDHFVIIFSIYEASCEKVNVCSLPKARLENSCNDVVQLSDWAYKFLPSTCVLVVKLHYLILSV